MFTWMRNLWGGSAPETTPPAPKPVVDYYYNFRPLFDLLGKAEGTDWNATRKRGRGYNETLSYGAYTGGNVELVSMTLGEIDRLQTQMLRHPANKWNSSALGRYQIVRTTLRKLKKTFGLGDSAKFDEGMQDYLCLQLLNGRGLQRYLNGTMSEDAFLNELAKEWASIPTTAGVGHYGNQKRTPVTPNQVRQVLHEVKRRVKG